jgi:hypothetical protein
VYRAGRGVDQAVGDRPVVHGAGGGDEQFAGVPPAPLVGRWRAVAVIWRCKASMSVATIVSNGRVPQAVAIRAQ